MVWGTSRGIGDLLERLGRNDAALTSLCILKGRRLDEADAIELAAALSSNTSLLELTAASHQVSGRAAAAFASALAANTTLVSLDLGNRSFGDEGVSALAPGIAASASLRRLVLEGKGLTAAAGAPLAAALAASSTLEELLLADNALGGDGVAALLGGGGGGASSLQLLDLGGCALQGGAGVAPLADALAAARLPALRCLRLGGNELEDEGVAALAAALPAAAVLARLDLQRCGMGAAGVAALAGALPPQLTALDLSGNALGGGGTAALAAALAAGSAPGLRSLLLCACGLDDGDVAQLAEALCGWQRAAPAREVAQQASTGAEAAAAPTAAGLALDLSGNAAGPGALAVLARAPLAALCLHDCRLGGSGAELAGLLARPGACAGLEELDLSGNRLEAGQLVPLLEALAAEPSSCPRLRLLVVAANPGAAGDATSAAVEALHGARPALDVVRRAADTGEGGLMAR